MAQPGNVDCAGHSDGDSDRLNLIYMLMHGRRSSSARLRLLHSKSAIALFGPYLLGVELASLLLLARHRSEPVTSDTATGTRNERRRRVMASIPMDQASLLAGAPFWTWPDWRFGAAQHHVHAAFNRNHVERSRPGLCGGRVSLGSAGRAGHVYFHPDHGGGRSRQWAWRCCCSFTTSSKPSTATRPAR